MDFMLWILILTWSGAYAAWSYTPNNRKNYDDAQADCVAQGGNLASFRNAAELASSFSYVECSNYLSVTIANDIWFGMRLDTSSGTSAPYNYIWRDGTPATYFDWDSGEPNAQSSDYCIRIYKGLWKYRTWKCNALMDYVCEVPDSATTLGSCNPTTTAALTPAPTTTAPTPAPTTAAPTPAPTTAAPTPAPTTAAPTTTTSSTTIPTSTTEPTTTAQKRPLDEYWDMEEIMVETGYMGLGFGFGFIGLVVFSICTTWLCCCIRKRSLEKELLDEPASKPTIVAHPKSVFQIGGELKYIPQDQDVLFS